MLTVKYLRLRKEREAAKTISIKLVCEMSLLCARNLDFFFFPFSFPRPQFLSEVNDDGLFLLRTKRGHGCCV